MLVLTKAQREQCQAFLDELYRWNERVNLTTVPAELAWQRHVEESVELAKALLPTDKSVVDIGSGGGIPGLVLAILAPTVRLCLVEGDSRKAGFLMHAAGLLDLPNLEVVAQRAEVAGALELHHGAYDLAVSRAAGPPQRVLGWAFPFLRAGGRVLLMAGDQSPEDELAVVVADLGGSMFEAGPGLIGATKL